MRRYLLLLLGAMNSLPSFSAAVGKGASLNVAVAGSLVLYRLAGLS
ncbi:MAG: hypothetical protein ACLQVK_19530 [Acidimicrobiales bacterium]